MVSENVIKQNKVESVDQNFTAKKKIVSDDFTTGFIQMFRERTQVLFKPSYSVAEKGTFPK